MSGLLAAALIPCQAAGTSTNVTANVLVMGDSLSAAYGLPQERGWVALLAQRISERAPTFEVINASISGETSAGGRARLGQLLQQHQPQIVILELGANDGLRGLPISALRENLSAMIADSRASGARVVLIGMHLPPNYGKRYAQAFYESFELLAKRHRVAFVPFLLEGFATEPGRFQTDRIHPNETAQPLILNNVWPTLAPLLQHRNP
ncbi:MAG TPA: arylesterase [Burkholderiaceae bacterium]|nr:arylesterase [Burkholderiaceae bacterium]